MKRENMYETYQYLERLTAIIKGESKDISFCFRVFRIEYNDDSISLSQREAFKHICEIENRLYKYSPESKDVFAKRILLKLKECLSYMQTKICLPKRIPLRKDGYSLRYAMNLRNIKNNPKFWRPYFHITDAAKDEFFAFFILLQDLYSDFEIDIKMLIESLGILDGSDVEKIMSKDNDSTNKLNEFTTYRRVLAFRFLYEELGMRIDQQSQSDLSRFAHFLFATKGGTKDDFRDIKNKTVYGYFKRSEQSYKSPKDYKKHLSYIADLFEKINLNNIVEKIQKEIKNS